MKLIDKDALVAEIKRYKHKADERLKIKGRTQAEDCKDSALQNLCGNLLYFIDTLEVKEVDLETEILDWIGDEDSCKNGKWTWYECNKMLRHFFELGVKANNPITSADRGAAEEIIINLKKIESDYNVCLTKEIEWVRKQVGQPELKTKQG